MGLLTVGSYSFVVWNTFPSTEWRLEGLVKFVVSEEDVCGAGEEDVGRWGLTLLPSKVVLKHDLGVLGIAISGVCFVCLSCGDQWQA